MKTLLFLSRVTFIYNVCMIVAVLMGYFNFLPDKEIKSNILVAGLFLSVVFNGLIHLWIPFLLLKKRSLRIFHPAWLFVINFLCFIYQIYMLLNDTIHY
jgi:hypothetical protein